MEKDLNDIRKSRRSGSTGTQEFFTPDDLANEMFDKLSDDMFTDFSKTYCDTCAGNGNLIITFLNRRLQYCKSDQDILSALSTIYAVELMQDNVDEMKSRIIDLIMKKFISVDYPSHVPFKGEWNKNTLLKTEEFKFKLKSIIDHNIVCSDFFKWDFDNWKPKQEIKSKELF